MGESADRRRFYIWKTLGSLLEHLPVQLAVRVAQGAGWLVALRRSPTRDIVEDNLRTIVEDGSSDPVDAKVLDRWVRRSYASYARYWAEGATLPALDPGIAHSRGMFIEGEDHLRRAMAQGRGVIIALPHIGSWEWGGAMVAKIGFPMTAVAEQLEPPEMFEWFVEKREAVGIHIVPLDKSAGKRLITTLREGGLVGLLCDRDLAGDGIEAALVGRTATVPAGPATLALRTGAVLLAGVVYSGPGNQHSIYISPPIDTSRSETLRKDVARVTQDLTDVVSGMIRRAPEQWHVFVPGFAPGDAGP
jgi:KDO2-lipid IV(A) lauroyltransferase